MTDTKDEFDKAFEEVAAAAEKSPEQAAAAAKAAEEAAAAAAAAAKTPEQVAAEAKAAEEATAKAAADAKAAEEAAAAAARAKPAEETPEAKAAREALEASIKPYEPSEEETAALAKFKQEFPGEYVAVEARLKSMDKDINARVYAAVQGVLKEVAPRLQSVEATAAATAEERHFAALRAAHPDFDAAVPKVEEWIKTRPAYLRPAMQAVFEGGAAADVIQLISDYKAATGTPAAASAAAPAPAPKKPDGSADLEPVNTRRSTPVPAGGPDKKNYDVAWAELTAATG